MMARQRWLGTAMRSGTLQFLIKLRPVPTSCLPPAHTGQRQDLNGTTEWQTLAMRRPGAVRRAGDMFRECGTVCLQMSNGHVCELGLEVVNMGAWGTDWAVRSKRTAEARHGHAHGGQCESV